MAKTGSLSIKEIARTAKVSHSTVARALRNSPLVSPGTADRIRRIAAGPQPAPGTVGPGVTVGRTFAIGVVVGSIADPFVAEIVSAIEETAEARGYSIILAASRSDPDREMKIVQRLEERRVDGLLLAGSRVGASYASLLAEMAIPIVMINGQHSGVSVGVDMVAASQAAVRFLGQLGHRRIGYVADRFGFEFNGARHDGYHEGLLGIGLPYRPELVVSGDSGPEGGGHAMDHLFSLATPPTAVFCYNDMTALGVLAAARRRTVPVPAGLSIVGFDDLLLASYTNPPLTTVRQPTRLMGRLAAEILINLLDGSTTEASRRVQGDLIVRESTAPPPVNAT